MNKWGRIRIGKRDRERKETISNRRWKYDAEKKGRGNVLVRKGEN